MSLLHPAKGVDYYGFSTDFTRTIEFSWPINDGKGSTSFLMPPTSDSDAPNYIPINAIYHGNVNLSTENVAGTDSAHFQWSAFSNNVDLLTCFADIDPITGNMSSNGQPMGNLANMLQTPSLVTATDTVCYGFYDSSTGDFGLTNQDQAWVYVTENQTNWMGDLGSATTGVPFNRFVLPAAHDSGMYDPTTVNLIAGNYGLRSLLAACMVVIPGVGAMLGAGFEALPASQVARELINFAFTQKDDVTTLLNIGIRYFDFRPAYGYSLIGSDYPGLYHQHSFVPGVSYATFLQDMLTWLNQHPTEIVVLNLNFAQLFSDSQKPTAADLKTAMHDAQQATNTQHIQLGSKNDLGTAYDVLIQANRRLLLMNQLGFSQYEATKYDSYSTTAYHTTSVSSIITALNGMSHTPPAGDDYTVLQLQGTVTGTTAGVEGAAEGFSDATSPLLSTKPSFDQATYSWITDNIFSFNPHSLVVLLNDFADNALVRLAAMATSERLRQ